MLLWPNPVQGNHQWDWSDITQVKEIINEVFCLSRCLEWNKSSSLTHYDIGYIIYKFSLSRTTQCKQVNDQCQDRAISHYVKTVLFISAIAAEFQGVVH